MALRAAGASFQDIATQLGYKDHSGARQAVQKGMENIKQESAAELHAIQYERLNHMLLQIWPKVNKGDNSAISTALSIMDRMNALKGVTSESSITVNQNVKHSVLVIEGDKEQYIAALRKARGELPDAVDVPSTVHKPATNA